MSQKWVDLSQVSGWKYKQKMKQPIGNVCHNFTFLRWISFVLKFIIYIPLMNLIWVFVVPYGKSVSPKDARKQPTIRQLYVDQCFFSQDRKIRLISSSWLKPGNKSESNDVITSTHCAKSKILPRRYSKIKQDTFKDWTSQKSNLHKIGCLPFKLLGEIYRVGSIFLARWGAIPKGANSC